LAVPVGVELVNLLELANLFPTFPSLIPAGDCLHTMTNSPVGKCSNCTRSVDAIDDNTGCEEMLACVNRPMSGFVMTNTCVPSGRIMIWMLGVRGAMMLSALCLTALEFAACDADVLF
jgi:hypothetical protein